MLNFIGSLIWSTFLVPLYFYWNNYPILKFKNVVIVVAILSTFFIAISAFLKIFIKNTYKLTGLLYLLGGLFWFLLPAVAYLQKHHWLFFVKIGNIQSPIALILTTLFVLLAFSLIKFYKNSLVQLNRFCTFFSFILMALLLFQSGQKTLSHKNAFMETIDRTHGQQNKVYPNIYHILLDAHPNMKAMETIGGDIKPFYHQLETLGFLTYPNSCSNYPATIYSVPSMLSMNYLEGDETRKDYYHYCSLNQNNKVFETLRKFYTITITNSSDFMDPMYPSKYLSSKMANNNMLLHCFYTLFQNTPIKTVFEKLFSKQFALNVQKNIHNLFKNLIRSKKLYGNSGNYFYAHVLCPHEPFIYGEHAQNQAFDGFISKKEWSYLLKKETHKAFCDNTYGIDNEILPTLKKIIKQYENEPLKPIIILHGDHSVLYCGIGLKNPYITKDTIYGNLFALYVPETWKSDAKYLTFINLYRFIFNHLFNTHYEYLAHKQICRGKEYGISQ